MKNIFSIILLLVVCFSGFAQNDKYSIGERTAEDLHVKKFQVTEANIEYVLTTPYVDTAYKIYDYAELLTETQRNKIKQRCREFMKNTGLDIAIVTINENPKPSFNDYAPSDVYIQDFYDYNDFKGDGVMLIIDQAYGRNRYYDAGKPCDMSLIGNRVDSYAEHMKPLYQEGDYYGEIMWFIDETEAAYQYEISFPKWKCLIFALLFAWIIWWLHRKKYKLVFKATSANDYKKQGSFELTKKSTQFVRSFTTKTYSPQSKSSGGSGHGSSGGSHSGGGF
ncbi:MAG: TPM domain-containing protein [Bacteroidales bacterium]|nr:TPM domain-containing protein [Bacteroidales bacterium]